MQCEEGDIVREIKLFSSKCSKSLPKSGTIFRKVTPQIVLQASMLEGASKVAQSPSLKTSSTSSGNCAFGNLRKSIDFVDVTLACEDCHQIEAHKVILAA